MMKILFGRLLIYFSDLNRMCEEVCEYVHMFMHVRVHVGSTLEFLCGDMLYVVLECLCVILSSNALVIYVRCTGRIYDGTGRF